MVQYFQPYSSEHTPWLLLFKAKEFIITSNKTKTLFILLILSISRQINKFIYIQKVKPPFKTTYNSSISEQIRKVYMIKAKKQIVNKGNKESSKINKQILQLGTQLKQIKFKRPIMLRYRDSLKSNSNKDYYVQTDQNFTNQINTISKGNQNALISLIDNIKKNRITDEQCDYIDFYARLHYKANIVNKNTDNQFTQVQQRYRCNCGCQRTKGNKLYLSANTKQMSILGSGVVLLFMFKKTFSCILLTTVLIYAIFAIVTNYLGNNSSTVSDCVDVYCQYRTKASSQNKLGDQMFIIIQWWMGVAFCFVWIFLLRLIKYLGKDQNQSIDKYLNSSSDYGIIIQNLPYGEYQQNDLIAYFDLLYEKALKVQEMQFKQLNKQDSQNNATQFVRCPFYKKQMNKFNMKSIQLIYNMQFSRTMVKQIIQLAIKIKSLFRKRTGYHQVFIDSKKLQKYKELKQQICQTFDLLKDLRKKFFYDDNFRREISTSVALVEFFKPEDKNLFLKYFGNQKIGILKEVQQKIKSFFKKPSRSIMFRGKVLKIMRAPQPSDMLFTNCQKKFSVSRLVLIYVITFGIILVSFGLISFLEYLQQRVVQTSQQDRTLNGNQDDSKVTIINIVISLGLQVVNRFLWFALYYILDIEYNHTLTHKIVSQMNKVLFATSINIIVLPIITNYVVRNNVYGSNGLAGMVFDYQVSLLGVGLVMKLIDPSNFVKRVLLSIRVIRNFLIRFLCQNLTNITPSQGVPQINNLYEGAYFNIAQSYVYIMAATYHAVFFCQLQPSLLVLVALVVICFYWVNKFKVLRTCKIPQITQILVFETALSQAALVPVIYGVGTLVISYIQPRYDPTLPEIYVPAVISIGIGILGFFNPKDFLNKTINFIMKKCATKQQKNQKGLQRSSSHNGSDQGILGIFENKQINDAIVNNQPQTMTRLDNYFRDSNSLSLIGFQHILSGGQFNKFPLATLKQLQKYCQNFLQSQEDSKKVNRKINQTIINNLIQTKQPEYTVQKNMQKTQTKKVSVEQRVQKIKLPKITANLNKEY